jgi:hypothetical protein
MKAMNRATSLTNDRLGPYVFAFAAGAIALSGLGRTRQADQQTADAKARAEIADKLLDRLISLYRARQPRRRLLL